VIPASRLRPEIIGVIERWADSGADG
jgi:hypothetical protein